MLPSRLSCPSLPQAQSRQHLICQAAGKTKKASSQNSRLQQSRTVDINPTQATESQELRKPGTADDTTPATTPRQTPSEDTSPKQVSPTQTTKQQQAASSQAPIFAQRVLAEVGLIEWPSIPNALLSTGLVILIVSGSSFVLFFVNLLLADGFQKVYNTNSANISPALVQNKQQSPASPEVQDIGKDKGGKQGTVEDDIKGHVEDAAPVFDGLS